MKAVFLAPNLNVGGFERQWSVLVPGLVDRGLSAEVLTLDGTGRFFDELGSRGVPVRYLDVHGSWNILGAMRASRAVAEQAPDVIVTAGTSAHVVGQLASLRSRAPHVAAVHSIPEHADSFTRRRRAIVRRVAPHVAASTAVTTAQLEFLGSLGFDRKRMHVIPNGVAPPTVVRRVNEVRAELGVAADAFVAVLIASLRREKRVERFLESVVAAERVSPRIRGFVVGAGPELERIGSLCVATDVVRALGPRHDTQDLIAAADVVCLTSDAEALPLVILEAMAGARPVVTTDVGGVRDAVVHGETGFVLPVGDIRAFTETLTRLSSDPALGARLGAAGLARQRRLFTLERMVDAHYALFHELRHSAAPAAEARR